MRRTIALALILVAFWAGAGWAGTSSACVSGCDGTAQQCMTASYGKVNGCLKAARKSCLGKQSTELSTCLTTTCTACNKTHSAETEACETGFLSCFAGCGPQDAGSTAFWCVMEADTADGKVNKAGYCSGEPGGSYDEQLDYCMKQFAPPSPINGAAREGCRPL